MKRFRSIVSVLICALIVITVSGCKDEITEYPVEYGGAVLQLAPNRIISMSDAVTSVIKLMGYDDRLIEGEFGTNINPDINAISAANPNLVLTTSAFSSDNAQKIINGGAEIAVLNLPVSYEGLKQFYIELASLLGGNITGKSVADRLIADMDESFNNIGEFLKDKQQYTAVIFYEEGYAAAEGSLASDILSKCGGKNLVGESYELTYEGLQALNPDTIFVPAGMAAVVKSNEILKELSAVKNNHVFEIDIKGLNELGGGFMNTVYSMLEQQFPDFLIKETEQ